MSERLTVRLPSDLSRELAKAAARRGSGRSELVRLALRRYLDRVSVLDRPPADRARHLIGAVDSGEPDLAEEHRKALLAAIRRRG